MLAALLLAVLAVQHQVILPLTYLASGAASRAAGTESDQGGQTASPNPGNRGAGQEERVRQLLAEEYDQRFGASDEAIRRALGVRGKITDFVGYQAHADRWLIAESKGSNISDAIAQLRNTAQSLIAHEGGAIRLELRIYTNPNQYNHLTTGRLGGWAIDQSGYLGWFDELGQWHYEWVQGFKILVQSVVP